jgi:hypothetical protein
MQQEIIDAIARDAAGLGRALYAEGVTDTGTQARIVAGAMPGMVAHELAAHAVTQRRGYSDTATARPKPLGADYRPDPRIPGPAVPGER